MIAKALEHNGATVYIVGRRADVLEQAAAEHNVRPRSSGPARPRAARYARRRADPAAPARAHHSLQRRGNLIPVQGDVTSRESMLAVADTVRQRHGHLNLLVNNAGLASNFLPKLPGPGEVDIKKYQELLWTAGAPADFAAAFDVNVSAAWYASLAFLDLLDAGNRRGNTPGVTSQILTVSSGGGFRKDDKVFSVPYTLSKAAATHLGKMLAHFLKDWQIRSNVIAPGIFPSGASAAQAEATPPARPARRAAADAHARPLRRDGRRPDLGRVRPRGRPPPPRGHHRRHGRPRPLPREQGASSLPFRARPTRPDAPRRARRPAPT